MLAHKSRIQNFNLYSLNFVLHLFRFDKSTQAHVEVLVYTKKEQQYLLLSVSLSPTQTNQSLPKKREYGVKGLRRMWAKQKD